jgi:hypothetical protein
VNRLFRAVTDFGVVAVRGTAFHEVDPVAGGRLKPIEAWQAPTLLAKV